MGLGNLIVRTQFLLNCVFINLHLLCIENIGKGAEPQFVFTVYRSFAKSRFVQSQMHCIFACRASIINIVDQNCTSLMRGYFQIRISLCTMPPKISEEKYTITNPV